MGVIVITSTTKNNGLLIESYDCGIGGRVEVRPLLKPIWLQACYSIACFRLYGIDTIFPSFDVKELVEHGICFFLRELLGCSLHDG